MLDGFYIATINIIVCSLFSYYIGPIVKKLGAEFKIFDIPDVRKVHTKPIVRIGGVSIFITFLGSFLFTNFFNQLTNNNGLYEDKLFFIVIGSIFFFLIGIHDDIYKSSPLLRLFLQFLVTFWVSFNGIGFSSINFYLPFYGDLTLSLPFLLQHIFNAMWIVGLTNAINWIDGIDSLAAGYSSILSFGLCLLMLINGNYVGLIFFSIVLGSIIGFLIRNFKPAFYIMGDCGSNFLGFLLSTSSLLFINSNKVSSINIYYLLIIFSLPIFDMLFVITSRFINNKNIFLPDRGHIHHRLIDLNLDHKYIIFILYFYSVISVSLGIFLLKNY
tara:strand:- start:690 stop:1676 length:987 start_codon:yes stop_codon:yes gene_type:complete